MDPNAALMRIREVCRAMDSEANLDILAQLADELISLVQGLDEWLSGGGFPPAAWSHNVEGATRRVVSRD